jgi:methyl-accepting chemotaxis protein
MADVRGTLGLSLANIRAYLLTGDPKFAEKFDKLWAKNEVRFKDLQPVSTLLNETQFAAFEAFAENRVKFAPLPPKMFGIRGSKKWNMANYLLAT